MTALAFSVPGPVRGKGRPRFGNGRTYTDAKTASYEALVGWYAREAMGSTLRAFEGPVCVTIAARIAPPASASRSARVAMLSGETAPAKRPDVDNLGKAALDGMNGIAFADDAQVVSLFVRKLYAETPGLDIVIRPYRPAEIAAVAA